MQNALLQPNSQDIFYWIHGEDVARNYPQQYGTKALYMDTEDPVFYARIVDSQGNTTTFEIYDYTKREPPAPPSYATTDDLASLYQQLESMKKMLEDLTAPAVSNGG